MNEPKLHIIKKHHPYNPKWSTDTERLILYADFMGFKSRVLSKTHEELKYYGIVVHNTAEKTIKKYQNSNNPYTNTPIYIERGRTAHYHLCWNLINQQLAPENITPQCKKWIEDIAERVSGYPRVYVDRTIEILEADERKFSLKEEHNAE